jgi:TonB family protein
MEGQMRSLRQVLLVAIVFALFALQPAISRDAALSLDLLNADHSMASVLKPYMIQLRQTIENRWIPKSPPAPRKTKLFLQLRRTGQVLQLAVQESSGDSNFDDSAVQAVQDSAPFASLPSNAIGLLNIEATFDGRYVDQQALMRRVVLSQNKQRQYSTESPVNDSAVRNAVPEQQESPEQIGNQNSLPAEPLPAPSFRKLSDQTVTSDQAMTSDTTNQQSTSEIDFDKDPNFRYKQDISSSAAKNANVVLAATEALDFESLTRSQKNKLGSAELEDYEQRFQNWLQQPPEIRFGIKLKSHATKSSGTKN